jgi:hypothetical protein
MSNKYTKEHGEYLSEVVTKWQQRVPLTTTEQRNFSKLVTGVCDIRWNTHFGKSKYDWGDTKIMREELPLVFLQYLSMRRSVRTYITSRVKACPIDSRVYPSLAYVLTEFRRQFPRIVSVLTARHVGVSLLHEWEPDNVCYMVRLPVYTELHDALCIMRRLSNDRGVPLYNNLRYNLVNDCYVELYRKMSPHTTPPRIYDSLKRSLSSRVFTRVQLRRAIVVYAASDILNSRVHAHHDACIRDPKMSNLYELHSNNTNGDDYDA